MENSQVCGVYVIYNKKTHKRYIGSSKDIFFRLRVHFSKLKNNKHVNEHLQSAYNKYGAESFDFNILEECLQLELLNKEQHYINLYEWKNLYNKTKIALGGGADAIQIPLYLLDLKGEIIQEFESGVKVAEYLSKSIISYNTINTKAICKGKYRIVTTEFYRDNLNVIKAWKNYSNESKQRSLLRSLDKYKVVYQEVEYLVSSKKHIADITNLSSQRISQIFKQIDNKGVRKYYNKNSRLSIEYLF